jgi:flagellar basal body-associated protein FliL
MARSKAGFEASPPKTSSTRKVWLLLLIPAVLVVALVSLYFWVRAKAQSASGMPTTLKRTLTSIMSDPALKAEVDAAASG